MKSFGQGIDGLGQEVYFAPRGEEKLMFFGEKDAMNATRSRLARWMAVYAAWRARWVNGVLSIMYGQPVEVSPKGHVGLAGAVVLWYLQDGFKQFLMVRGAEGDGKARFLSCLGVGRHGTLPQALRAVTEAQLGAVFAQSLGETALAVDRVAAAPVFSYADEASGLASPVQALVWVVQMQAAQVDLIEAGNGVQAMVVPEFAMSSQKVSPTHRALWQSVARHIPKGKMVREGRMSAEALEESIKELNAEGVAERVLH